MEKLKMLSGSSPIFSPSNHTLPNSNWCDSPFNYKLILEVLFVHFSISIEVLLKDCPSYWSNTVAYLSRGL
jgi:hypothetical protein